jgi:hypothetical protein
MVSQATRLWVLLDEVNTLADVLLEVADADIKELLLVVGDLSDGVDLLNTVGAELNVGGEVLAALVLVERRVDESWLDDVLLALGSLEERLGETGTSHGHGEGGRASTVLGLDDLVTTELDAVDVAVELLALEVVAGLGQEGDDGCAGVATNNGDVLAGGVGVLELGDEARGTDNVEGGDTEEALGVVDTRLLEDLGGDGDGGVDGVGDDQDVGLGGVLSGGLGQVADDGGVGVEQVCATISCVTTIVLLLCVPSRVMPGLRGTPAGMTTISAPLRASARPEGVASWPVTFCASVG